MAKNWQHSNSHSRSEMHDLNTIIYSVRVNPKESQIQNKTLDLEEKMREFHVASHTLHSPTRPPCVQLLDAPFSPFGHLGFTLGLRNPKCNPRWFMLSYSTLGPNTRPNIILLFLAQILGPIILCY